MHQEIGGRLLGWRVRLFVGGACVRVVFPVKAVEVGQSSTVILTGEMVAVAATAAAGVGFMRLVRLSGIQVLPPR